MKTAISLVLIFIVSLSAFNQENEVELTKINKIGEEMYAVVSYSSGVFLRSGYIFNIYSKNKKVGKIELDSVNIERAFGYMNLSPTITDYNTIIENHELVLYKSYFFNFNYIYEYSLSDRKDQFQQISLGLDFYPSFSSYRKQDNIWLGADIGYLFGNMNVNKEDRIFEGLGHVFVKLEVGHSPFYKEKTRRGLLYGVSIRPHIVKFYVDQYYGTASDDSNDAYLYIKNNANLFLGFQYSVIELRVEMSLNKMEIDNKYIEDMNSLYFRLGFSF